jgi:hypothetical protein
MLQDSDGLFKSFGVFQNFIDACLDEGGFIFEFKQSEIGSGRDEISTIISDDSLDSGSGNEISSPITMFTISIWEEVIILSRISVSFLINRGDVISYS